MRKGSSRNSLFSGSLPESVIISVTIRTIRVFCSRPTSDTYISHWITGDLMMYEVDVLSSYFIVREDQHSVLEGVI